MRSACTPRQGPSHPPPRHRLWQRLEATLAQGSRKTSTWRSWHSPRPLPRPCSRSTRRSTRRRRPGHTRQRAHVLGAGRSCLRAGDRREHAAAVGRGGNSGLRRRRYVCTPVHAASSLGKEPGVLSAWRLPLPHDAEQALAQAYLDSIDDAAGVQSIVPGDEGAPPCLSKTAAVPAVPEQRCRLQTRVQPAVAYAAPHAARAEQPVCPMCRAAALLQHGAVIFCAGGECSFRLDTEVSPPRPAARDSLHPCLPCSSRPGLPCH